VSIVKWVTNLESINCISITSCNLFNNFSWGKSVLVHTIVELDTFKETSAFTRNKMVALGQNGFSLWVFCRECTESASANLFFSIIKESWLANNSEYFVTHSCGAFKCYFLSSSKCSFLFVIDMLSDWN
jgi:hypothetical protein